MKIPADISPTLASRAYSLETIGLDEVGWAREDVFQVLDNLEGSRVAILGGDVYNITASGPSPAYANWYCERKIGESLIEYAKRSHHEARSFILNYPINTAGSIIFVPVFTAGETAGL